MNNQEIYAKIEKNPSNAFFEQTGTEIAVWLATVPVHLHRGLVAYILLGVRPGSFLQAIIANDLQAAAFSADDTCKDYLIELCKFRINIMPDKCHGDYEALDDWCSWGGMLGRRDAA